MGRPHYDQNQKEKKGGNEVEGVVVEGVDINSLGIYYSLYLEFLIFIEWKILFNKLLF